MAGGNEYVTPIHRFYIDIRPLIPANKQDKNYLPLIETLFDEQQQAIKKYLRPADRLMSLASALLKYTFLHRNAHIPWTDVRISKTPKPHHRPYWQPTPDWNGSGGVDFNVTHQNGLVAIIGCTTPTPQNQAYSSPIVRPSTSITSAPAPEIASQQIRLGVDIACTKEDGRTPKDVTSQAKLDEWVDIFGEVFSWRCRQDMKHAQIIGSDSTNIYQKRLRRFYAYWSLQEAFIKMVGEGLLAEWLKELEFENVHAPEPATADDFPDDGFNWAFSHDEERKWTPPEKAIRDIRASVYCKRLDDVRLELLAYEEDFLMATSIRGVQEANVGDKKWIKLDIEDIRPCAEGRCKCLDRKQVGVAHEDGNEYSHAEANGPTRDEDLKVPYP